MTLDDSTTFPFTYAGATRTMYPQGAGPAVIILHVLPGMIPEVIDVARRVVYAGFTAYLPHLFGEPGRKLSNRYICQQFVNVCLRREFYVFAARKSSPITEWLRALCRRAHAQCGAPGVGAVGMCFTGGFALSLVVDPSVMAPVLSQPSLPMLALTKARKAALGISPEELAVARERVRAGVRVLGLRFTQDALCPRERFDTLRHELGDGFEAVEIDSSPSNPHGIPPDAHGVLTNHFVDREGHPTREALDRVLALFRERLTSPTTPATR
jgi:dienelactone hydrolase